MKFLRAMPLSVSQIEPVQGTGVRANSVAAHVNFVLESQTSVVTWLRNAGIERNWRSSTSISFSSVYA